jgi:hypothetical protein
VPPETQQITPTQEVPPEEKPEQPPVIQPSPEIPAPPVGIIPKPALNPALLANVWCEPESCYGNPYGVFLHPAAAGGVTTGQIKPLMIWWPWIFTMIFCFLLSIPRLVRLAGRGFAAKKKTKR